MTYPIGVCYYPEHWPESEWENHAEAMAQRGITYVRIGEFSWSRIEPKDGTFKWGWLDRAFEVLSRHGLKIMLGTPTATPPKWLVDSTPDMLAITADGQPRGFGSRRHYCFSSQTYLAQAKRITTEFAQRYGRHRALFAWQTDNEYGCHDTTRSYSSMAASGFRLWLQDKYKTIDAVNLAWGTVFWSQEYTDFSQIDLHNQTVTEPTPAHVLDFYRYSSDQVIAFNQAQCDIIRAHSDAPISHNFMGHYAEFDHFKLAKDLDFVTWDSYPLGFLDQSQSTADFKAQYRRQGDPDFAGFHHDLYRGCHPRWAIIEQQPGPVNWAPNNAAPLPGMVDLWTWEGFAHGAEFVSYFRWQQCPFAQEQFHAGLNHVDASQSAGGLEAEAFTQVQKIVPTSQTDASRTALIFDYEALWMFDIQPQGRAWNYESLVKDWYRAARALGLNIDVVSKDTDLDAYDLILIPSLPIWPQSLTEKLQGKAVLIGPRSASKTEDFAIPADLAPGKLRALINFTITQSESLPPGVTDAEGHTVWRDYTVPEAKNGMIAQGQAKYFTTVPSQNTLQAQIKSALNIEDAAVLPEGLRLRQRGKLIFAFNYAAHDIEIPNSYQNGKLVFGDWTLAAAQTACWTLQS